MVQRLEWSACDAHGCHCDIIESEEGDMVSYEDYANIEKLLEWVCSRISLYDLPPCEQRNKLEEMGLL